MRAIIFVNGTVDDYAALDRLLQPEDYLIAADGGVYHCLALNRMPHILIGDLDSVDPATLDSLAAQQVPIARYSSDKNETDLELALDHALGLGDEGELSAILLVGAMGGRLDQLLGNVLILAQRDWPVPLILESGTFRAQVVRPSAQLTLTAPVGSTVSALPLSDRVTGITYTGMRYPLENHTLPLGSTRGMSNVVDVAPATVKIASGKLLIVEQHSDRSHPNPC